MKSTPLTLALLWVILAVPAALILYSYAADAITYGRVLHITGETSVRLLIVTLAVTPLRLAFPRAGWTQWMMRRRRAFGVATFGYALLHLVVYLVHKAAPDLILREAAHADLLVGWIAMGLFAILAITSNDVSVRLLARGWKRLHRLVYPAAALALLHWFLTAFTQTPSLVHAAILVAVEAARLALAAKGRAQPDPERRAPTSA